MRLTEDVTMTPEWARELIEKSDAFRNRNVRRSQVAKLARVIRAGDWQVTHQGILIDEPTGFVVDGQHRLRAIVAAGVPVPLQVTYDSDGLSKMDVIDVGLVRTARDVLHIEGVPYGKTSAAACRLVGMYDQRTLSVNQGTTLTAHEIRVAVLSDTDRWQRVVPAADAISAEFGNRGWHSVIAAGLYIVDRDTSMPDTAASWYGLLRSGVYGFGSPELALRRWFTHTYTYGNKGGHGRVTGVQMVIRAYNHHVLGSQVRKLSAPRNNVWVEVES